jgi:thiamine-phosphate pyrophosphorylase
LFPTLYAILDPNLMEGPPAKLAKTLAEAGVNLIQFRDKLSTPRKIYTGVRELISILAPFDVRLIVNDRPDIAALAGAGGVHVGQHDLPVQDARSVCRVPIWVGVSTHNSKQVREADSTSADYIAVGPIFTTASKENPDPVVGLEFLHAARQMTRKPLVAIGGITLDSAEAVFEAGADSVAVIRDLTTSRDPVARAQEYMAMGERMCSKRG